ncbi:hypothetical protein D3C86_1806010 [compost metagenome]
MLHITDVYGSFITQVDQAMVLHYLSGCIGMICGKVDFILQAFDQVKGSRNVSQNTVVLVDIIGQVDHCQWIPHIFTHLKITAIRIVNRKRWIDFQCGKDHISLKTTSFPDRHPLIFGSGSGEVGFNLQPVVDQILGNIKPGG